MELTQPWDTTSMMDNGVGIRREEWQPVDDPRCQQLRTVGDNVWLLSNCFKILMMQAGFAVVESSFVRQRNSANIMMKNVVDVCMGALGFWAIGWALAYGVDPTNPDNVNSFCGTGEWFMIEGFDYAMWMFQFSFAATAATIDSGAVAERMNFKPYVLYSTVMTSFIQPIVCHWCWSAQGWLTKMGFHDFAGSGPVHLVGGASALVAAWFIGPRTGRFAKKDVVGKLEIQVVQGENLPMHAHKETHPYVVIQQVNHGHHEARTRAAQNSKDPRWGLESLLSFEVRREVQEEEAILQDLKIESELHARWTTDSQDQEREQEYHGIFSLQHDADSSGHNTGPDSSTTSFRRHANRADLASADNSARSSVRTSTAAGELMGQVENANEVGPVPGTVSGTCFGPEHVSGTCFGGTGGGAEGVSASLVFHDANNDTTVSAEQEQQGGQAGLTSGPWDGAHHGGARAGNLRRIKSTSGKTKRETKRVLAGFAKHRLLLDPSGKLCVTLLEATKGHAHSKVGKTEIIKLKHLDLVEKWQGGKSGFNLHLEDMRILEVQVDSEDQRDDWMRRLFQMWRPTISPQKLQLLVIDSEHEEKLGNADFVVDAGAMPDPEKFAQQMFVDLDQGQGRVELQLRYTSSKVMSREIFQACDPVKLLFGMFVLWINWYSFNVGSTNKVSGGGVETAGRAALVTTLGAAAGAMVSMIISDITHGYIEPEALTTGILGALVAITAPCAVVTEAEGAVIGAIGAALAILSALWEIRMQIDDPCSAFAIHGACGIWGVLSVGLFAQPEPCMDSALRMEDGTLLAGVFRGGGWALLGVQALAALTITAWSSAMCLLVLGACHLLSKHVYVLRFLRLRPTKRAEELGFDQTEHNVRRASAQAPMPQKIEVPPLKRDSQWRGLNLTTLAGNKKKGVSNFAASLHKFQAEEGGREEGAKGKWALLRKAVRDDSEDGRGRMVDQDMGAAQSLAATEKAALNAIEPSFRTAPSTTPRDALPVATAREREADHVRIQVSLPTGGVMSSSPKPTDRETSSPVSSPFSPGFDPSSIKLKSRKPAALKATAAGGHGPNDGEQSQKQEEEEAGVAPVAEAEPGPLQAARLYLQSLEV